MAEWLRVHFPERGGKLYDSTHGTRYTGTGLHAELLAQRFRIAFKRLGFQPRSFALDTGKFRLPPKAGDQLALF